MITDPRVTRFANEQLRPLAERTRALQAEIETTLAYAANEVIPAITAADDGALLDDGRDAEGVSRLTREDLLLAIGLLEQLVTTARDEANEAALAAMFKACVRPLRITSVGGSGA